jgi:hypothetical protein
MMPKLKHVIPSRNSEWFNLSLWFSDDWVTRRPRSQGDGKGRQVAGESCAGVSIRVRMRNGSEQRHDAARPRSQSGPVGSGLSGPPAQRAGFRFGTERHSMTLLWPLAVRLSDAAVWRELRRLSR